MAGLCLELTSVSLQNTTGAPGADCRRATECRSPSGQFPDCKQ
jgi:hypothetical protein